MKSTNVFGIIFGFSLGFSQEEVHIPPMTHMFKLVSAPASETTDLKLFGYRCIGDNECTSGLLLHFWVLAVGDP
jgi:hypothetical protein